VRTLIPRFKSQPKGHDGPSRRDLLASITDSLRVWVGAWSELSRAMAQIDLTGLPPEDIAAITFLVHRVSQGELTRSEGEALLNKLRA